MKYLSSAPQPIRSVGTSGGAIAPEPAVRARLHLAKAGDSAFIHNLSDGKILRADVEDWAGGARPGGQGIEGALHYRSRLDPQLPPDTFEGPRHGISRGQIAATYDLCAGVTVTRAAISDQICSIKFHHYRVGVHCRILARQRRPIQAGARPRRGGEIAA